MMFKNLISYLWIGVCYQAKYLFIHFCLVTYYTLTDACVTKNRVSTVVELIFFRFLNVPLLLSR